MTYPHPPHPGPHGWGGGWMPPPAPPKPGVIPLAPLGLGDVLGGAFTTIGRHWKQLLGFAALVYGAAAVLFTLLVVAAFAVFADSFDVLEEQSRAGSGPSADVVLDEVLTIVGAFGAVYLVGALALMLANALLYGSCPAVLQDAVLGVPSTLRSVWNRVRPRVWAVLGAQLLVALIIAVPVVLMMAAFISVVLWFVATVDDSTFGWGWLFFVGLLGMLATGPLAIWLWVRFSFAPAVAVIEGRGAVDSLKRSAQLVRGAWWRVFGISLLAYLIAMVAAYLIQLPFQMLSLVPGPLSATGDSFDGGAFAVFMVVMMVIMMLAALVSQILTAAFPQLVLGLLYMDARFRKENLAPALAEAAAAARQTPPGTPGAPPQAPPYAPAP
ncbi:hypothetical protein [Streptomyces sp. NPDC005805]|uniref:DUF7847 domain-containing protein n=1 Tax=Streptomyces sp. NPDC005805 TaxID=3157068 RepID=UPI0033E5839E